MCLYGNGGRFPCALVNVGNATPESNEWIVVVVLYESNVQPLNAITHHLIPTNTSGQRSSHQEERMRQKREILRLSSMAILSYFYTGGRSLFHWFFTFLDPPLHHWCNLQQIQKRTRDLFSNNWQKLGHVATMGQALPNKGHPGPVTCESENVLHPIGSSNKMRRE